MAEGGEGLAPWDCPSRRCANWRARPTSPGCAAWRWTTRSTASTS